MPQTGTAVHALSMLMPSITVVSFACDLTRFAQLFGVRPAWRLEDIKPFLMYGRIQESGFVYWGKFFLHTSDFMESLNMLDCQQYTFLVRIQF